MRPRRSLHVTRHIRELSEKQTDEVVGILAGLIVNYVKNTSRAARDKCDTQKTEEVDG